MSSSDFTNLRKTRQLYQYSDNLTTPCGQPVDTGCNSQGNIVYRTGNCNNPIGRTGPQGPAGPTGHVGTFGDTGPRGPTGFNGFIGPTGPTGQRGVDGYQGVDGATGYTGPTGNFGGILYSDIIPYNNGVLDLGSPTHQFGELYVSGIVTNGDILPTGNNIISIGSPDMVFKDIHVGPGTVWIDGAPIRGTKSTFNGANIVDLPSGSRNNCH
jgi:hypothetical protein